jgi:hypothetical protein
LTVNAKEDDDEKENVASNNHFPLLKSNEQVD